MIIWSVIVYHRMKTIKHLIMILWKTTFTQSYITGGYFSNVSIQQCWIGQEQPIGKCLTLSYR